MHRILALERVPSIIVVLALCLATRCVADAATFYVVPVIGGRLTVLTAKSPIDPVGQTVDEQIFEGRDSLFDNAVFLAADAAIRKIQVNAAVSLLRVSDAGMRNTVARQLAATGSSGLQALLPPGWEHGNAAAVRLLLVVPATTSIKVPIFGGRGRGASAALPKITGLGFYVDDLSFYFTQDSAIAHAPGIVMPYASIALVLIDPSAQKIERRVDAGFAQLAHRPDAKIRWEAMTSEQRMDALRRVLDSAMDRLVPAVLSGSTVR